MVKYTVVLKFLDAKGNGVGPLFSIVPLCGRRGRMEIPAHKTNLTVGIDVSIGREDCVMPLILSR